VRVELIATQLPSGRTPLDGEEPVPDRGGPFRATRVGLRLRRRVRPVEIAAAPLASSVALQLTPSTDALPVATKVVPLVSIGTATQPDRASRGDTIVEIYQKEHLLLFRYIRSTVGSDAVAEDVLQETFLRLTREVGAGRLPTNVHAWLYRVATNVVLSEGRRSRTAERHLGHLVTTEVGGSPEQRALEIERDDALRAALAGLAVDARAALLLAAQGFSGREIAIAIGRTEGATRTLLCRARLRLRDEIAAYDGDDAVSAV